VADKEDTTPSPLRGVKNLLGVGPHLLLLGLLLEGLTLVARPFISFPITLPLPLQVALAVLCALIALAGMIWFNRTLDLVSVHLRGRSTGGETPPLLITHGPFNYVRHPLYAALMLTLPPLTIVWFSDLVFLAPWVLIYALAGPIVSVEEKGLVATFGEDYQRYRRCVPAFIPHKGAGGRRYRELTVEAEGREETLLQ
jgi:protein-S-isoprenylcysteine O-methyltransferase Ste14